MTFHALPWRSLTLTNSLGEEFLWENYYERVTMLQWKTFRHFLKTVSQYPLSLQERHISKEQLGPYFKEEKGPWEFWLIISPPI